MADIGDDLGLYYTFIAVIVDKVEEVIILKNLECGGL
jgi:hypothetical protein